MVDKTPSVLELPSTSASLTKGYLFFFFFFLTARVDVILSAAEGEDFVATISSLMELVSLMDWWLLAVRTYTNSSSAEYAAMTH